MARASCSGQRGDFYRADELALANKSAWPPTTTAVTDYRSEVFEPLVSVSVLPGKRTVNTEPLPGSLVTVTSPLCLAQSFHQNRPAGKKRAISVPGSFDRSDQGCSSICFEIGRKNAFIYLALA
jgi:hypothetical protein